MPSVEELRPSGTPTEQWRALAARTVEPNPFFEPQVLLPAVRWLGDDRVRLLVAREADGSWAGMLPVRRSARWRLLPGSADGTWTHPYAFLGAPLLARGSAAEAMTALLAHLRRQTRLVHLEGIPADGPAADALRAAFSALDVRPVVWSDDQRAALRRREDGRYLERTLSPKRRRELRRQRRLLAERLGGAVTCVDAAADPAAVEAFLRLEASGWKGRAGTAMAHAGAAEFFRDLCRGLARADRLMLLQLRAGGRLLATQAAILAPPGGFLFKVAHDEEFGACSPGVQLQLDTLEAFHARPELQWLDSCADPDNEMINRLWPDRRRMTTLLVPGTGPTGWVARVQAITAAGLRRRLKEHQHR